MRIHGISDYFCLSTISNSFDLSNLKRAEVEIGDIPKPNKKNIYVSIGRLGETYEIRYDSSSKFSRMFIEMKIIDMQI